jgi:hypothetical protein
MTRSTPKVLPHEVSLVRRASLLDEELKRSYHYYHHHHYDPLPPSWAPPTEVTCFLVCLLVTNDVPVDRAKRIANKWTLGSGKELRDYPAVMYLQVLGNEDAWVTYLAVQQAVHKYKSRNFWYRHRIRKYHSPADVET